MKKTYIEPSMEIVHIAAESLICDSPDGFSKVVGSTDVDGDTDEILSSERLFGDFQPEPFSFLW